MGGMKGIRLGRIAGIEIDADWSLLVIFLLIAWLLARGVFPAWHPDWSASRAWGVALAAAILFVASILLHELSHALVGRRFGVVIRRITLFMFGGVAQMENEPPTWRGELVMALAGPLTSAVLGIAFLLLASAALGGSAAALAANPRAGIAHASPFATLLLWLGPVNLLLAAFNLVPGFPLDGGRALRALMWAGTGDLVKATRWASRAGQGFAWLLMAVGVGMVFGLHLPVLGGGLVNGIWLAFIGWFLNNAALSSYRQLLVRESLEHVPVSRLMQTHVVSIAPDTPLAQLADELITATGQRAFPVESGGRLEGMVFVDGLHRVGRHAWETATAREVMVPAEKLIGVAPDADAFDAVTLLARHAWNQLPVIDRGRLVGLLRRHDVLDWMTLRRRRNDAPRA